MLARTTVSRENLIQMLREEGRGEGQKGENQVRRFSNYSLGYYLTVACGRGYWQEIFQRSLEKK